MVKSINKTSNEDELNNINEKNIELNKKINKILTKQKKVKTDMKTVSSVNMILVGCGVVLILGVAYYFYKRGSFTTITEKLNNLKNKAQEKISNLTKKVKTKRREAASKDLLDQKKCVRCGWQFLQFFFWIIGRLRPIDPS